MNIVLWVLQGILAALFLLAGGMKVVRPKEQLQAMMGWVQDFSGTTVKLIGSLEVLAAIGLILPWLTGIAEILTPLAAVGLVLLMIGAAATHVKRKEPAFIVGNVVLLAIAAIIAIGRF